MPSSCGITVSLQSQYDALTIPEHIVPSPVINEQSTTHKPLNIINVSIPTLPSSQFWISYLCHPSSAARADNEVRFYYFKLFVAGKCIVSWGVGEQDHWGGKTTFAPFSAGTDFDGRKLIEKKGFFFPSKGRGDENARFEIRVFRAKGRKSQAVEHETFGQVIGPENSGDVLTNIGRVKKQDRQRMYTYALIDAKDEPYIVFKYCLQPQVENGEGTSGASTPRTYSAFLSDTPSVEEGLERTSQRRLSVPPSHTLVASTTRSEPCSPVKQALSSDVITTMATTTTFEGDDVDRDTAKRREWVFRTPSPMISSLFDRPASASIPPARKISSGELLRTVVANVLKKMDDRRGCSSKTWPSLIVFVQ